MSNQLAGVAVLYGALRSGTTLLRLILDAHPEIRCPGERDFLLDYLQGHGNRINLDKDSLSQNHSFQAANLQVPDTSDGQVAFEALLAQDRHAHDRPHHLLVMHRRLDSLLAFCPHLKIVHLVRDPRDVARSSIGMGWAGNTWYGIDHWIKTETDWDRYSADLPEDQILTLQYENILRHPEEALGSLCEFLGLKYSPAMMMSYTDRSTYGPLDPNLAEQWRQKQSPSEIADVEAKVGDLLTRRGYEPSGIPPRAPAFVHRSKLLIQNKYKTWAFRFHRYGVTDVLLETFSRRLRWKSLGRAARARISEKSKKYLK